MRRTFRLVVLALAAGIVYSPLYAQQAGVEVPPKPHPMPNLESFLWKNPGADMLVRRDLVPTYGKGDEAEDRKVLQAVALGLQGYKEAHELFWDGLKGINAGLDLDPVTRDEIKNIFANGLFEKVSYPKGYMFYGPMAFGGRLENGVYRTTVRGRPIVDFDQELEVYQTKAFRPRTGPWAGYDIALAVPKICFNITLAEGVQVTAPYPVEQPVQPKLYKVEVRNRYLDVNGDKVKPPLRSEMQARVEARPLGGGDAKMSEFFDNERAELMLPQGKYLITDYIDTSRWRFTGNDGSKEITVWDKSQVVEFTKMRVIDTLAAANVPAIEKKTIIEREKKGNHKKLWITIGAVGGAAALAMFLPKRGKDTVVVERQKEGGSGRSPAVQAPAGGGSFSFSLKF